MRTNQDVQRADTGHPYHISSQSILYLAYPMISPLDGGSCKEHHEICFSRLDSTFRQNVEKPSTTHCLCLSQTTLRSVAEALDLVAPQRLRDVFHRIRHCDMIPSISIRSISIHANSTSFAKMLLLEAIHQSQTCHCCTVANAPAWTCSSVWWWGNADLSHLSHLRFCMLRLLFDVVSCCFHFAYSKSLVTSLGCRGWASNIPPRPVSMP